MSEDKHVWLLSSGGRRGALVDILRSTPVGSRVVVSDASNLSAAGHLADSFELVPRISDPEFIPRLVNMCTRHGVDSLVPTIDTELEILSHHRDQFAAAGTDVLISAPGVVELSHDKWKFNRWLGANGFPDIPTFEAEGFDPSGVRGPVVAKPRSGSSSIGVIRAASAEQLDLASLSPDYIIQQAVGGSEVTVDFAVSRAGVFLGAVPRQRLEVRGGEVSKGVTIRNRAIEEFVREFAEALPGAYGVLNVQVFLDEGDADKFSVLELNARVGGGFPLAERAGANFFSPLAAGTSEDVGEWEENLTMLRFDDAVFLSGETGSS